MSNEKLPIDPLRTRVWFREVMSRSGCDSSSEIQSVYDSCISLDRHKTIDPRFHSLDIRWGQYESGGTKPNKKTLEAIQSVFNVGMTLYKEGPCDLLLWKSLAACDLQFLKLLAETSDRVDGKIALFRYKIMSCDSALSGALSDLDGMMGMNYPVTECLNNLSPDILDGLTNAFKRDEDIEDTIKNLLDSLRPYSASAFLSSISDSRTLSPNYIEDRRKECLKVNNYYQLKELKLTSISNLDGCEPADIIVLLSDDHG